MDSLRIVVTCSKCGADSPHATHGCARIGCTWREEAIREMIRSGATIRVRSVIKNPDGSLGVDLEITKNG